MVLVLLCERCIFELVKEFVFSLNGWLIGNKMDCGDFRDFDWLLLLGKKWLVGKERLRNCVFYSIGRSFSV